MDGKLCFLVCENLKDEMQAVIKSGGFDFDDVALVTFSADCDRLESQGKVIRDTLLDCGSKHSRTYLLGGCCIAGSEELEPYRYPRVEQCFHLFQSQTFIDDYLSKGCHLLTPGWLERWRHYLDGWGFDQPTARQFFQESTARLVLLDTGTGTATAKNIQEFAEFIGLPYEVEPVGLDLFHLMIRQVVLEWRLNNARPGAGLPGGPRSADYAMALDLVGTLTRTVVEKEAIENIFDLFASLFAPETMVYLPVSDNLAGDLQVRSKETLDITATRDRLASFSEVSAWTESGSGFVIRIGESSDVLGVLEVDRIAFPEYRERYLNLALALNHVCHMAIQNARTYERLERAREALQVSEQRWSTTLASIGDAVIATDIEGKIIFMNAIAEALTGWTFLEAAGKPVTEVFNIINEKTRRPVDNPVARVLQEDVIVGLANHTVLARKDGTEIPIDDSAAPIRDQDGISKGVVLVFRDVAERRKAEEALRSSENEIATILTSVPLLIVVVDSDRRVLKVNTAVERFAGRRAEEMLGALNGEALGCLNSLDDPRGCGFGPVCQTCEIRQAILDTFKTGSIHHQIEWQFSFSHNRRREELTFLLSTIPLDTERKRVLVCLEDITERKKAEQMKDEFIGMVSHELRTPLTIIIGALNVATTPGVSEEDSRELLRDTITQANALAAIVENLLELSRHQAHRVALTAEPTDIGAIAQSVVQRLKGESAIHRLITDIPAGLPTVVADPIRIERIVYNLVHNAIKYSPNGGEVNIFGRQLDDSLVVGVSDQGIGITAEDRARLFKSFERLSTSDTRTIAGIGLGLRVCQLLVEAHGGRIWVESTPGRGSTFFFTLPG